MQTISLRGQVSENGILRLEIPFDTYGEEVDVVVVVQSTSSRSAPSLEELAGSIDDETLVEPDELPFEHREQLA